MGGAITEVRSQNDWDAHVQRGTKPVVVDFTATWCGPCKAVSPHFERMSGEYPSITFLKVDVDQQQQISSAAGVRAMPTFQIYLGGQKKEEITGADIVALKVLLDKYKDINPFQGKGRKLSSMADAAPTSSQAGYPVPADGAAPQIDEAQPTTSLQIRLLDGSRTTARFNTSHTVADLRRYIRSSNSRSPATFQLVSGFPPKPVGDDSLTLEQAGLVNAAVIQK